MKERDLAEQAAKAIFEYVFPNESAHSKREQSNGEHDFDLYRGMDQTGIMEVTVATDFELRKDIGAIDSEKRGGALIHRPDVSHGWTIVPMARASSNTIRKKVGTYLAAIEAEGIECFSIQDVRRSLAVRRIFEDLKVEYGTRLPTKGNIGLVILSHPSGPMVRASADHVLRAVHAEMEKADNRRKLRRVPGDGGRHLFVVIDAYWYAPWKALNDCNPPENRPELGDSITHLWVATITRNPDEWVIWHAVRGGSWQQAWFRGRVGHGKG